MELANIDQTDAAPALASFTIETATLGDAVALLAKRLVERRNTIPILSNVAICADVSGLITLTATDLDIQAAIELPADVESPGPFTCDAGLLSDILAKARKDKSATRVNVSDNGDRVILMTGKARNVLPRLPADDFPAVKFGDALPVSFTVPGAQFIADLGALAPCISKEESRYYLNGVSIEVRNLGGRDRLAMIATDGHKIGIASRELPQGADLMPDAILPRKVAALLGHVAKYAPICDAVGVDYLDGRFRLTLGAVTITAKAIDGTFPDWERLFIDGNHLAPTGEALPMFPELLPAAPLHSMQAIEKAVKSPIAWEPASAGMIATLPDDSGLMFGAVSNTESVREPVKGYRVTYDADQEAAGRYLTAIADQRAGHTVSRDKCRLQVRGVEILGLTVGDYKHIPGAYVDRPNWETLHVEKVWQEGVNEYETGAHSIVMPRDRAKLMPDASLMIDGDSTLYPLGINTGNTIHLSKDQVRAIVGESAFETMALTIAGRVIYILRWLFEQGDSRFLTVRADGRCFTGKDASKAMYLSRGQVEAALRGDVEPEAAPMPEIASPAPAQEESAPIAAQESGETVNALHGQEIAPDELLTVTQELPAARQETLQERWAREYAFIGPKLPSATGNWYEVRKDRKVLSCGGRWYAAPLGDISAQGPFASIIDARFAPLVEEPTPVQERESGPQDISDMSENVPAAPVADLDTITARLEALEQALATLSAESTVLIPAPSNESAEIITAPTARAKRTAAHERAIRRAWQERKARRDADAYRMMMERSIDENGKMFDRELAQVRAELDLSRQSTQQREAERDKWEADCRANFAHAGRMNAKRRATAQRARRMIAAARARADLDARALAITNATLSRLKRDMADPMQPERASDIARLVGERDTARTALAAMAARAERAEQTVNAMADRFEGLVSRVTRAEAALRQANAA